jgi:hypothetical protein
LNRSDRPGAFSDEGGRGYSAVVRFFCQPSFTKAQGLFLAGANDRIELFDSAVASKELRLRIAEGNLSLLARFTVCLCHGFFRLEAAKGRGNKKGQAICLTLVGIMLSTVPVHPWSTESRYRMA